MRRLANSNRKKSKPLFALQLDIAKKNNFVAKEYFFNLGEEQFNGEQAICMADLCFHSVSLLFSLELYLKLMSASLSLKYNVGHNVYKLYRSLPSDFRDASSRNISNAIADRRNTGLPTSIEFQMKSRSTMWPNNQIHQGPYKELSCVDTMMIETTDSYTRWRYMYEQIVFEDDTIQLNLYYFPIKILNEFIHSSINLRDL